jgi:hypothetical protein
MEIKKERAIEMTEMVAEIDIKMEIVMKPDGYRDQGCDEDREMEIGIRIKIEI